MFGALNSKLITAHIDWDPGADDDLPLFVATKACEIVSATVVVTNVVNGSTANYFDLALYNGGTAGTALTAVAGTIGGTAGWSALTPTAFTITNGTVAAGEVVKARYNEEGTGTFQAMVVQLEVIDGVA